MLWLSPLTPSTASEGLGRGPSLGIPIPFIPAKACAGTSGSTVTRAAPSRRFAPTSPASGGGDRSRARDNNLSLACSNRKRAAPKPDFNVLQHDPKSWQAIRIRSCAEKREGSAVDFNLKPSRSKRAAVGGVHGTTGGTCPFWHAAPTAHAACRWTFLRCRRAPPIAARRNRLDCTPFRDRSCDRTRL